MSALTDAVDKLEFRAILLVVNARVMVAQENDDGTAEILFRMDTLDRDLSEPFPYERSLLVTLPEHDEDLPEFLLQEVENFVLHDVREGFIYDGTRLVDEHAVIP